MDWGVPPFEDTCIYEIMWIWEEMPRNFMRQFYQVRSDHAGMGSNFKPMNWLGNFWLEIPAVSWIRSETQRGPGLYDSVNAKDFADGKKCQGCHHVFWPSKVRLNVYCGLFDMLSLWFTRSILQPYSYFMTFMRFMRFMIFYNYGIPEIYFIQPQNVS